MLITLRFEEIYMEMTAVRGHLIFQAIAIAVACLLALFFQDLRWLVIGFASLVPVLFKFTEARSNIYRYASLTLLAAIAFAVGFRIEFIRNIDGSYWSLGLWSFPITVVWMLLISRTLRFVHDQGGGRLALQVSAVVGVALFLMAALQSQSFSLAIILSLSLLLVVFWSLFRRINISPWLSQSVGIGLALITIAGMVKTGATLALIAPIMILGLPPLTFNPALGIVSLPRQRRMAPVQLFGLYTALSAMSMLAVIWTQRPEWFVPVLAAMSLIGTLLLALTKVPDWGVTAHRLELFGVQFHRLNFSEVIDRIESFIHTRRPHMIVTPDTTALMRARTDKAHRDAYDQADLVTADGTGIVWASKLLGASLPGRVTGIDVVESLCQRAAEQGYRVFFLGAQPGIAAKAAQQLQQKYPGLNIVGTEHGYVSDDDPVLIETIQQAKPDMLFVGMGVPRQEQWILKYKHVLNVPVMMGVGGSFDVLSGQLSRAPEWMQQAGLEWLYRVLLQPQRFWRVCSIPVFMGMIFCLKGSLWLYRSVGSTTSVSSS